MGELEITGRLNAGDNVRAGLQLVVDRTSSLDKSIDTGDELTGDFVCNELLLFYIKQ